MKIWKFKLKITDDQFIEVPVGAQLLTVQMQGDDCCVWVLCKEDAHNELRRIAIYGTGNPMPENPGNYLATFQLYGGSMVFHAFDRTWQ